MAENGKPSGPSGSSRPKQRKHLSIARYIAGAFVLTAAMTVLITASAIIIAYNSNRGLFLTDEELYIPLLVAGIIALVISVVLGLFFASGVGQPIQRISKAASRIKDGDLSARTGLRGDDELAKLGESFDDMADAIERDRDLERQLIGDVAHELRTPLMAIQATVEAIQDGVFPADEEHMDTISSETRRLGKLVEALLHLNRLENGTIVVKSDPIDMSELVNGLVMTHEALIEASNLTFIAKVEPDVRVVGDHDLLTQAVTNLLSNAVRYTPEGGNITLELARVNGYASVSVSDTGIGISEEDLEHVFSRFWRADSARTSVGGGLGIGLALVKEVADQHRGNVSVSSVLGEGSTFTINIPLSADDPTQIGPSQGRSARRMQRQERRQERRELDKQRKEQDKLKKIQERQRKEQDKAAEREERESERAGQQLTLFGIRVPLLSRKDDDPDDR